MAEQYINFRNLRFMLHEVLDASTLQRFEFYQDYDREAWDMTLQTAREVADKHLFPYYTLLDKEKAYCEDGQVWTHPKLTEGIKALADGGWIASNFPYDVDGQQMPLVLLNAAQLIWYSANANIAAHAFLTQGAANLVHAFGSQELKDKYLPSLLTGKWQGTMALTEPQAGSSLTDIVASATLTEAGHYKIIGQKIYISAGDHLGVENVVHLLLARIDGAPAGTKGISLFVVPKHREEDGKLVSNDVATAGIYGKMGQKGYVAAHLMYGEKEDCHGYLVGQPNKGLSYMFQMMNEARIGTGIMATGNISAAYYAALQYANERPQGRHPGQKDPNSPPLLIIEHADVRRMLLFQKSVLEGSIALLLYCGHLSDLVRVAEGEEKEKAHLLLELMTPIAKSFPSEWGIHSVSQSMQCLGGAGYTDDFPVEQHYRDIRVNAIYEGTTSIHGMDLLGRKVLMGDGAAFKLFVKTIQACAAKATGRVGQTLAQELLTATKSLHACTVHLTSLAAKEGPRFFLADATLYLEYFALVCVAWQWLEQVNVAEAALSTEQSKEDSNFYESKLITAQFYFTYELPKIKSRHETLHNPATLTLDVKNHQLI